MWGALPLHYTLLSTLLLLICCGGLGAAEAHKPCGPGRCARGQASSVEAHLWGSGQQHAEGAVARAAPGAAAEAVVSSWAVWPKHKEGLQATGPTGHAQIARHRRQLLQASPAAPNANSSSSAMDAWLQSSERYSKQYQRGSCFPDYPGFVAKDITDFVRLIKDPAATHIELKGNLLFTTDYFPPENTNDKSKGINITHKVEIRACTSREAPIIVDVNNVMQQIYVFGCMSWRGTIKFVNSFPSPRRGGLFPLISVLSVEGDGVILFEGLQIQGNEPSPLFNRKDPFWEVYAENSQFAPHSDQYTMEDSNTMVVSNWTFNKTAWVLKSQGTKGVVKATGNGYWQWVDVLITWAPPPSSGAGGLTGSALALAVALPVVFGTLLLVAGAALLWCCCCRRQKRQHTITADHKAPYMVQPSNGSKTSNTGPGPSMTGGSTGEAVKLEMSHASNATTQLIEQARRRMQETTSTRDASIILESLIGEGTFGKVYSGNWKGTVVAVKTMLLPAAMSGKERREKMAIMETAISSSLSHPNIVQTYTYEVKPLSGELARQALDKRDSLNICADPSSSTMTFMDDSMGNADNHGWEVRLVLELCDFGNLKEFLSRGGFKLPDARLDMAAIVATALDIARAMLHLHTENIIHSDLKARNVLLKSAGADVRGFVAKVSDFGLSMRIDPSETHVSNFYQGTLTHMAPEVLMYGKISFASDVYAFGIMLWEMYTAQQAFKGVPRALLGHEVTSMRKRPEFPPDCPFDYQLLACRCWESDPAIRPTFAQILADLDRMHGKLQGQRRMDSASSLPMQNASSRRASSGSPPAGDVNYVVGNNAAAAAAAAAAVGAVGGAAALHDGVALDAAKYHCWEPQTSLLELGSTQGGSTNLASKPQQPAGQHLQTQQPFPAGHQEQWPLPSAAGTDSQQLAANGTLGTWDAPSGAGLWMSGSLAPVSLPSDMQFGHASLQHMVGVGGGQQHLLQNGAAVHGAPLQQQHRGAEQWLVYPAHNQQQGILLQQQQCNQQQQQHNQQQHGARGGASQAASSSGVYLDNNSSTVLDVSTQGTDCTAGTASSTPPGASGLKPGHSRT